MREMEVEMMESRPWVIVCFPLVRFRILGAPTLNPKTLNPKPLHLNPKKVQEFRGLGARSGGWQVNLEG